MASVIWKQNQFGATRTLHSVGCSVNLSDRGRKALVREATMNMMVTLTEFQHCSVQRGQQKENHFCSTPPIRLVQNDQTEATPQWKAHDSPPRVCQKYLNGSQTMRNKILWSDDIEETRYCSLHGGGSIMLCGCFLAAGPGRLMQ